MPEQTDEGLLVLIGESEAAFMALFERHREVVFRVAYRLTSSVAAAEDIAQECFLGLLDAPGRFDPAKGSLRTYLYGAVRNQARKYHGLLAVEALDGDVDLDDRQSDDTAELSEAFLQQEQSEVIRYAISTLPLPQREALILFQYEELTLEEIAAILDIEIGAVKSRLHRARMRLKRILTPYFQRGKTR